MPGGNGLIAPLYGAAMSRAAGIPTRPVSRPPGASIADTPATRLIVGVLTGALLTAVALPARRLGGGSGTRVGRRCGTRTTEQTGPRDGHPDTAADSFPFSHYPMFSAARTAHYWVTHVLGVRADGSVAPLHHSYLGTGGLNAVRRQVRRRVRAGDGPMLAERAAQLIAVRGRVADLDVVRVHIVRGRYLVEPFMLGKDRSVFTSKLDVRGSADVPGRAILRSRLRGERFDQAGR